MAHASQSRLTNRLMRGLVLQAPGEQRNNLPKKIFARVAIPEPERDHHGVLVPAGELAIKAETWAFNAFPGTTMASGSACLKEPARATEPVANIATARGVAFCLSWGEGETLFWIWKKGYRVLTHTHLECGPVGAGNQLNIAQQWWT